MSIPVNLVDASKVQIFSYSADSDGSANLLRNKIGGGVTVYQVHSKFPAQNIRRTSSVAWLVGHGKPDNTKIGSNTLKRGKEIAEVCAWLKANGYTDVVDACGNPNLRKSSHNSGLNYYCANDNQAVSPMSDLDSVQSWWSANNISQA